MVVPWLVGGDFNVILTEEEKYGGLPVYLREVKDFAHCNYRPDLTRYHTYKRSFGDKKLECKWFKYGDRNTKFFHTHVKGKRKRLQVSRILDNNGN